MDTLDMPSTLNSQMNGSVENEVDTTPVPTETNDDLRSCPLQQLISSETPVPVQQNNLQFTGFDSFLNDDLKNSNRVSTISSQLQMNQRPNLAPLHVECDPVSVLNLFQLIYKFNVACYITSFLLNETFCIKTLLESIN